MEAPMTDPTPQPQPSISDRLLALALQAPPGTDLRRELLSAASHICDRERCTMPEAVDPLREIYRELMEQGIDKSCYHYAAAGVGRALRAAQQPPVNQQMDQELDQVI
jgi:hypothetical protein